MITQYFDMLKDIGMNSQGGTIFLPHSPGSVGDAAAEVRGAGSGPDVIWLWGTLGLGRIYGLVVGWF